MGFVAGSTIVPVTGATLMSRQGMRPGRTAWHNGIDLASPVGTPVYPAAGGIVYRTSTTCLSDVARAALSRRETQRRGGPCACPNCTVDSNGKKNCGATYGNTVVVRHGEDFYTVYAHLDTVLVAQDQVVTTSTQLGTVGTTTALLVGTGPDAEPSRCTTMAPHLHLEVVKSWPLAPDNTTARYDVLHELAAGGVTLSGQELVAKSWPLGSSDTLSRYDVLHELAAGGVTLSGQKLVVTGISSSYNEPALATGKAFVKKSVSYSPVPPGTPDQAKVSKWPLYVALGGLLAASALILWKLRRRLLGRGLGQ